MNIQTIRQLKDALTAFGAGKNVTVEMSYEQIKEVSGYFTKGGMYGIEKPVPGEIHTPGGFIITVVEKK